MFVESFIHIGINIFIHIFLTKKSVIVFCFIRFNLLVLVWFDNLKTKPSNFYRKVCIFFVYREIISRCTMEIMRFLFLSPFFLHIVGILGV